MPEILSNDGGRTVILDTALKEKDILFYNTRRDPFKVYGLYKYRDSDTCRRLPREIAEATSPGVAQLSLQTAGARLRFRTDSEYVAISVKMPYIGRLPHMPLTGTSAFDLYLDTDGGSHYYKVFKPDVGITNGYESVIHFGSRKMRSITVYFPLYNAVDEFYIGLQQDARVGLGEFYRSKLPVVFYGNSITQGACASRAGLAYESHISRRLDLDFMNLGFSGNGRAELPLVNYMATLNMLAFVSDYDHNAPTVEYLRETHCRMYDIIRESHPDIPYIMLSRPDFIHNNVDDNILRRDVVADTFRYAREKGDKNVWFIDGSGIFRGPDVDSCTVDGTHPNDIGMLKMADAIGKMLERSLRNSTLLTEV